MPRQRRSGGLPAIRRGVDRADRSADHPIGLDAGLVKRLIDADLIGAERAAALKHQHHLAAAGAIDVSRLSGESSL